ncbi:MAG: helix-turn-helix domain-containing protein [Pyrinomonadaceae bacterium]
MNEEFQNRLKQTFDFATMAEIARRLGIPHATVRNYFHGRLPAPEVLIKIAKETNISLNWLLSGVGDMYASEQRPIDLERILETKVEEILDRRLARALVPPVQDFGAVDEAPEFDVKGALRRTDDPQDVMSQWFRYEGREYPKDYGVVFFQGWETYTGEEKIEALNDAKKVLDRTLKTK